ncbi:MAG: carboxypeptidase regulatory-like domain-containing protein [Gemmatimonadetes bacterium]|nr:carboxypeptidase regulatory-like domain-containing protein [Gemmatimonadota bacterium]
MRHISLCLVVPFVLACGIVEPDSFTILVKGTVTAADDGTPVAGATVGVFGFAGSFGRRDTTTDASGHYSLSFVVHKCSESSKGIIFRHPGFHLDRILVVACRAGLQTIDVQLV